MDDWTGVTRGRRNINAAMKRFDQTALAGMSRFYRGNLINCLTGIKPALLIGTKSKSGKTNLAIFSSVFHLGADPALIGFVQRPLTEYSHTYRNIVETGFFTVNHIHESRSSEAHSTSAKFEQGVSEFDSCGFTEEFFDGIYPPFVKESLVRFSASFVREIPIDENGTRIIIARVEEIQLHDCVLRDDGNIRPDAYSPLSVMGLETYLGSKTMARYEYAKPGVPSKPID